MMTTVRQRVHSIARYLPLALLLSLLSGCGLSNGFTGGGFPIGRAAFSGKVVLAESPLTALPDARLTLTVTGQGRVTRAFTTVSGPDGRFDFGQVRFEGTTGTARISIRPPTTGRRPQELTFVLSDGKPAVLIAALASASFDTTQGTAVTLSPAAVSVPSQQTVQFAAHVRDKNGNALPVVPSLLFIGNVGNINGDGTFYGASTGSGTITALWYGNLVSNTVPITVDNSVPPSYLPPPPPVLPMPLPDDNTRRAGQGERQSGL
jgi:hypothetical protein